MKNPEIIRFIVLIFGLLQYGLVLFSQNSNIDSLKNLLNTKHSNEKASLLSEIADAYIHNSPNIAQKYINEAINEANKNNNIELLPEIYRIYGIIKYFNNELDSSLFYYQKSKKIAVGLNDELAIASVNVNIGGVFFETNEYNKALSSFLSALEIFNHKGIKENEAITYNNIGLIYNQLNKPDSALFYFNNSLQLKKELNNDLGQAYTLINMAIVEYKFMNDAQKAISYFNTALDILLINKDSISISILHNEFGNFYFYRNDLIKAKKSYSESLKYSQKVDSYKNQKLSFNMLYKIAVIEKNDKKALNFYQKYIDCKDTIENNEIIKNLNELKLKYETEKKEQRITFLYNEQKLNNEQIRLQQKIIVIFIFFIIVTLIFLLVIFIHSKKMKLANKNLAIKNLEIVKSEKEFIEAKNELEIIIKNSGSDEKKQIKKHKLNIESNQEQELLLKILDSFEKDQLFLDQNLAIDELAKKIDSNKTYISYTINKNFKMNFSSFVNQYRVKKARILLSSSKYKNYTIETIAQESGFKSITVFNKAFKKFTGLTPSNFIKNLP
ncbi:MAG: hypothetical protein B6D64_09115 [Bacteroidetes bacterium 4484_276]|nr:MAG: hypothetical protein B6D64_09115 [Bacteroidetes bacterium 4484_276]